MLVSLVLTLINLNSAFANEVKSADQITCNDFYFYEVKSRVIIKNPSRFISLLCNEGFERCADFSNGKLNIRDTQTDKIHQSLPLPPELLKDKGSVSLKLYNHKKGIAVFSNGPVVSVYNINTKETKKYDVLKRSSSSQSSSSLHAFGLTDKNNVYLRDYISSEDYLLTADQEIQRCKHPDCMGFDDGGRAIASNESSEYLADGKKLDLSWCGASVRYDVYARRFESVDSTGNRYICDLNTKSRLRLPYGLYVNNVSRPYTLFSRSELEGSQLEMRVYDEKSFTCNKDINIRMPDDSELCKDPILCELSIDNAMNELTENISKIQLQVLCAQDFNKSDWDKHLPPEGQLKSTDLSYEASLAYLLRFSKPGGFDFKDHTGILLGILNSKINETNHEELGAALQSIAATEPEYYQQISSKFPKLSKIKLNSNKAICRTPKENDKVSKGVFQYMEKKIRPLGTETSTNLHFWSDMMPLLPVIKSLPKAQQTDISNKMYRTLANGAVDGDVRGVFISKVILFTKNYVKKLFGESGSPLTDISVVEEDDRYNRPYSTKQSETKKEFKTIILSTDPIYIKDKTSKKAIEELSSYGFYYHAESLTGRVPEGDSDKKEVVSHKWKTGDKNYSAKVTLQQKDMEYVKSAKSPDYNKMWADKQLNGLVLISDNLMEAGPRTARSYVQYYIDNGFEFDSPKEVKNTSKWLHANISSGKIDYVLKEAHAGGMDQSLLTFSANHKLMIGIKKATSSSKAEEIYILVPNTEAKDLQRLEYLQMKDWMTSRKKNGGGPLVYLNSSCWSMVQATNEVKSIESPLFIDIASVSKTTSFINNPKSTKYHIMEGLRQGRSYEEMRDGMKTTTRHQEGYNDYHLPDDPRYLDQIGGRQLQSNVKIRRGFQRYHLDEAARQNH